MRRRDFKVPITLTNVHPMDLMLHTSFLNASSAEYARTETERGVNEPQVNWKASQAQTYPSHGTTQMRKDRGSSIAHLAFDGELCFNIHLPGPSANHQDYNTRNGKNGRKG